MYKVSELHEGDILLMVQSHAWYTLNGALDELIKWATVNPFDHTGVVVKDGNGELQIAEALVHVTLSPIDKYEVDGWAFKVNATETQKAEVSQAAGSKVGQFYGWEMLIEDAVRDIGHVDWARPINPRQLDCSAFVAWCYKQAGIDLTYAPVPSPADLSYSPLLIGKRPWIKPQ